MKLRQENPDLLELCHSVPMEVIMAGEGMGLCILSIRRFGGHPDVVSTASALTLSFPCLPSQRSSSWTPSSRIITPTLRTGCSVTWCLA